MIISIDQCLADDNNSEDIGSKDSIGDFGDIKIRCGCDEDRPEKETWLIKKLSPDWAQKAGVPPPNVDISEILSSQNLTIYPLRL